MQYLEKNLEALKGAVTDEYMEKIRQAELPEWAMLIKSKNNKPNLLTIHGNKKTAAYDIEDPQKSVDYRISNFNFTIAQATIVVGMGLGYFVKTALENAKDDHKFLVVEPVDGLVKTAFTNVDLSEYLETKQLVIIPTKEDAIWALEIINEANTIDEWSFVIEPYTSEIKDYQQLSVDVTQCLNQIRCNIGTVTGAGSTIAENDIANLPYIIHRRGVVELSNKYKGKPAVIVSTGPSLSKNIHHLIKYQNNIIIIAVGQALRPLLAYGIRPDFICSVDFGEVNLTHYEGLMETNIPLIALNRSFAPLLKRWQGPMFVATSPTAESQNSIHTLISQKGATIQGGSVAHMAFGCAILMGCSPIMLIGQDLAYDGTQSHCPQADSRGTLKTNEQGDLRWDVKDPRCHLHGKDYSMGVPIIAPGYFLTQVTTNSGLASFIAAFENFVKVVDTEVINATEGGAHIQGTKRMSFIQALETYSAHEIKDKYESIAQLLTPAENANHLVSASIPLLQSDIDKLVKIISLCKSALKSNAIINKYQTISANKGIDKKQFNIFSKAIKRNKESSDQAEKLCQQLPLMVLSLYGASRKIRHKEMSVKWPENYKDKDAQVKIKRNKFIIESALESAKRLKTIYQQSLNKIKRAHEQNNLELLTPKVKEPEPNISDAKQYFSEGNFARPLLEAYRLLDRGVLNDKTIYEVVSKAEDMRDQAIEEAKSLPDRSDEIEYINLVNKAHEIGRDKKDFKKCVEMLKEAVEKYPKGIAGRWGLATAYWHTEQYDKSIKEYENLLEEHDIPRHRFELGQVLIYSKRVDEGIKQIRLAMEKSKEFDSFMSIIAKIFIKEKKYKEAVDAYKHYLKLFPADVVIWDELAETAELAGDELTAKSARKTVEQMLYKNEQGEIL